MSAANNGGPAFPQIYWDDEGKQYLHGTGMTLRDYFAAKAMQALIAHEKAALPYESRNLEDFDRRVSYAAYRYADAMLAERAKGGAK